MRGGLFPFVDDVMLVVCSRLAKPRPVAVKQDQAALQQVVSQQPHLGLAGDLRAPNTWSHSGRLAGPTVLRKELLPHPCLSPNPNSRSHYHCSG